MKLTFCYICNNFRLLLFQYLNTAMFHLDPEESKCVFMWSKNKNYLEGDAYVFISWELLVLICLTYMNCRLYK